MPMQWTLANERLLLLGLLDSFKGPFNYKELAANWPNPNEKPTPRALSEHIFKLRKLVGKPAGVTEAAEKSEAGPSTPKTPRGKAAPRSGSGTASGAGNGSGKGKRKRDAMQQTPERAFTPINGSRIKTEITDEATALDNLEEATPSKRARKPTQRPDMIANEGSDGEEDELRYSSVDPEFAPDDSSLVDYDGNADRFELPAAF